MAAENISLIRKPPPIALLEDGAHFTVKSERDFSSGKAEIIINVGNQNLEYLDNSFSLKFMGKVLIFTFREAPNYSGNELTSWDNVDSFETFLAKLVDELNANFYINKYFVVGIVFYDPFSRIIIQARNPSVDYNITLSESLISNLYEYSITPGTDPDIPGDYAIYFGTYKYVDDQHSLDPLGMDSISLDSNKEASINIADYLDSQIITQFTYPFSGVYARILEEAVLKYFIKYSEFENNEVQSLRSTFSEPGYIVRGGLNVVDSDLLNGEDFNFFDYEDNIQKFLNHAPINKITYPEVPELLYFYISSTTVINVILNVIKSSGVEKTTIQTLQPNANKIAEFNVGISDLLLNLPLDNIISYQIWLENDQDLPVSEIRTFTLDHQVYLNKRILFFQNSFDLYETICCRGDLSVKDGFVRQKVEVSKGIRFETKINQVEQNQIYNLSSGWLPGREYRLWLTEVLLSKDTFYMLGDILLPVLITNTNPINFKDRENLYSIDFSFTPVFSETRYSSVVGEGILFLLDETGTILLNENDIGLIAST